MKWIKTKLTDISRPKQWKNLPMSELTDEGYTVYGANGIIGKYKEFNHEFPTLAITCRGATSGSLHITEPKSYITSNAMALDDLSEKVNLKFLYYALKNRGLKDTITGSAQPQITRENLSKVSFNIPEKLSDQIHIANLLSKSENLIKQRKESIELLDKFLESTFYEMFGDPVRNEKGWEKVSLSKLGSLDRGVSKNRPRNSPELLGGKYPLIQTGEVSNSGLYITSYSQTYSELGLKQSKLWEKGTMLITIAANIAQTSILTFDACFPDSIVGFITDEKVANTIYVHYLFSFFQEILEKNAPQAAQKNINLALLRSLPVPKPSLELQNQFALIVDKVEALRKDYSESLLELENLFGSLNQRTFKGELEFKNIPEKEIGGSLEGIDLPKDKSPSLDDILKQTGDKWEDIKLDKKEIEKIKKEVEEDIKKIHPRDHVYTPLLLEAFTGSIKEDKPKLEDIEYLITKLLSDKYFTFMELIETAKGKGWIYDFEVYKNFVLELLRNGKLKQVFADAAFKSSFIESDADFKKIKELNEQMYLKISTSL